MASFGLKDLEDLISKLERAASTGDAYRVSKRHTLDDGEELILHVDPQASGGTVHIESPAIASPQAADVDVWENAEPNSTTDDFFVHATRYDVDPETPEANVTRVPNGDLNTTGADQTEQTRILSNREYNTPGGEASRGLWRTIPVGETVSFVITDQSGGAGNEYGFDTVIYEGDTLPD